MYITQSMQANLFYYDVYYYRMCLIIAIQCLSIFLILLD